MKDRGASVENLRNYGVWVLGVLGRFTRFSLLLWVCSFSLYVFCECSCSHPTSTAASGSRGPRSQHADGTPVVLALAFQEAALTRVVTSPSSHTCPQRADPACPASLSPEAARFHCCHVFLAATSPGGGPPPRAVSCRLTHPARPSVPPRAGTRRARHRADALASSPAPFRHLGFGQ